MKNSIIKSRIFPLDVCVTHFQSDKNKKSLFCANGFIYRRFERFYLVTALSVVTGRDIYTGQIKHLNNFVPDCLVFNLVDKIRGKKQPFSVPLYMDDMPVWMVHPTKQRTIDLAVIPLDEKITGIAALNDFETDLLNLTDDVFMCGYPLSFYQDEDKNAPLLQKTNIVSNEEDHYEIESLNRQGFYGALLFANQKDSFLPAFLGVYSGFDKSNTSFESQTSVWKKEFIDEIIDSEFFDESYM